MIQKVWAYVVREGVDDIELLVFDQEDAGAGVQIPAGTMELDEDAASAVRRELNEEAGVKAGPFIRIAVREQNWGGQDVRAHLFAAWALPNMADEWVHAVSGNGEDRGMRFRLYWLPHAEWNQLYGDFRLGYPPLNQFIADSRAREHI